MISKTVDKAIIDKVLKSANEGVLFDALSTFKGKIDSTTGFLTAPVNLARTGIQYYYGYELGLVDRALEQIGVFRPAEEVFHVDSIKSFVNLVVTDDHPDSLVGTDNVKQLQVGTVSEAKQSSNLLSGIVTITDKSQIAKIKNGKAEVSVGYLRDLVPEVGEYGGEKYEFVMRNIQANHLAIVDAGRCGAACRLNLDHKKGDSTMVKVKIDGLDFDVENDQLAQAIQNQQSAHDAEMSEKEKELEKLKKEKDEEEEKLKKEKEAAEGAKDAALKLVLDDKAINKLVADRAQLLSDASKILGKDNMPSCDDCPETIKAAVVKKVLDMDIADKSAEYINATYDIAVKQANKATTSLNSLGNELSGDKELINKTREDARSKYMKDQGFDVVEGGA